MFVENAKLSIRAVFRFYKKTVIRARLKNQKRRLCVHNQLLSALKILVNREIGANYSGSSP
jgi:hypothetical protein